MKFEDYMNERIKLNVVSGGNIAGTSGDYDFELDLTDGVYFIMSDEADNDYEFKFKSIDDFEKTAWKKINSESDAGSDITPQIIKNIAKEAKNNEI